VVDNSVRSAPYVPHLIVDKKTKMNTDGPPPIPEKSDPINFIRFEGEHKGLHTASHDRTRLDIAQKQAQEWINQNPYHEIVSINSSFGHYIAIVTVWYR